MTNKTKQTLTMSAILLITSAVYGNAQIESARIVATQFETMDVQELINGQSQAIQEMTLPQPEPQKDLNLKPSPCPNGTCETTLSVAYQRLFALQDKRRELDVRTVTLKEELSREITALRLNIKRYACYCDKLIIEIANDLAHPEYPQDYDAWQYMERIHVKHSRIAEAERERVLVEKDITDTQAIIDKLEGNTTQEKLESIIGKKPLPQDIQDDLRKSFKEFKEQWRRKYIY